MSWHSGENYKKWQAALEQAGKSARSFAVLGNMPAQKSAHYDAVATSQFVSYGCNVRKYNFPNESPGLIALSLS
jgi:hypothetical protein